MVDWLNPTNEMMEGRHAGRQDRNREVEELEQEIEWLNEVIGELKDSIEGVGGISVCTKCNKYKTGHEISNNNICFKCQNKE